MVKYGLLRSTTVILHYGQLRVVTVRCDCGFKAQSHCHVLRARYYYVSRPYVFSICFPCLSFTRFSQRFARFNYVSLRVTCGRPGTDAAKCPTLTRDYYALLGICHVSLRFAPFYYGSVRFY
jgi:hypothetical protein